MEPEVEILARTRLHDGFYKFDLLELRHRRFDGSWSPRLRREVLVQRDAVAVLPWDPDAERVLLVEQFRAGAYGAGESGWLLEAPAGLLEPGESPEACARRELHEECGLTAQRLEPALVYRSSPGGTTERVTVFIAEVQLPEQGGLFGAPSEHEDIRTHLLATEEAFARLRAGMITASTGVIPLLWLELNRERLKAQWRPQISGVLAP